MAVKTIIVILILFFINLSSVFSQSSSDPEIKVTSWQDNRNWQDYSQEEEEGTADHWGWRTNFSSLSPKEFTVQQPNDGSTTIIASHYLRDLQVTCTSTNFPVQWERQGQSQEASLLAINTRDFDHPNVFTAVLEISSDHYSPATGNYTCVSLTHPRKERSLFIFWEGDSAQERLALWGRSMHVFPEEEETKANSSSWIVILPCYGNRPDVQVKLFKELEYSFYAVPKDEILLYAPKQGFIIQIKQIPARFKCAIKEEDDDDEVLIMTVRKGPRPVRSELVSNGTRLTITSDSNKRQVIACCARTGSPAPMLRALDCRNPVDCKIQERRMENIVKLGKNEYDIPKKGSCSYLLEPREYGVVRCQGDGIDTTRIFYSELVSETPGQPRQLHFSISDLSPKRMISLSAAHYHHDDDDTAPLIFYAKVDIRLSCVGATAYFDDGPHWAVRWRNGTMTSFQNRIVRGNPSLYHSTTHLALVELELDMVEFVCFLPVWNSSAWVNASFQLDVQNSSIPSLIDSSQEELKLRVNESGRWIQCEFFGTPVPSVEWENDHYYDVTHDDPTKYSARSGTTGSYTLHFLKVTKETEGNYTCHARNVRGHAEKTFQVMVGKEETDVPPSSTSTVLTLTLLGVSSFLSVIGALVWKLWGQKKIVDHLVQIVFRTTEEGQGEVQFQV